jgi:hypothetical protein
MARAQVNLWFPYDSMDFPLINNFQLSPYFWRHATSEDIFTLLNSNGYPSRNGTGATSWTMFTNVYVPDPGASAKWVVTWTGGATVTLSLNGGPSATLTQTLSTSGRKEYSLTSASDPYTIIPIQVALTGVAASNISNIKIFISTDEADQTAGFITTARFRATYSKYKTIRFMDYQTTNTGPEVKWSSRVKSTDMRFAGPNLDTSNYVGICSQSGHDYTASGSVFGSPSSWTHGQVMQCRISSVPAYKAVTGFSNANPASVTCVAHGFSTGDVVFSPSGTLAGGTIAANLNGNVYTITVSDVDHFTLNGVNSTTWGAYSSGGNFALQIRFKDANLPFKRILNTTGDSPYKSVTDLMAGTSPVVAVQLTYDSDFDALLLNNILEGARTGGRLETLVAIANELDVDPWFCIPTQADDDYVTQFATYIRDNLDAGLKAYFEYSNETWNTAFNQFSYSLNKATKRGFTVSAEIWSGYRHHQIMTLIETVFSGQMSRIDRVMGVFTGNTPLSTNINRFQAPGTGLASFPISKADSIAIAPYFEAKRSTTAVNQYVWQAVYGNAAQVQEAIEFFDLHLRDDGAVFDGSVSGNTLTVTNLISGTIRAADAIYGGGLQQPPSSSSFRTISSGAGSTWTISGTSLGTIAATRFNTSPASYTTKFLNEIVFPSWLSIASAPASGVGAVKLIQYEGGGGQYLQPDYGYSITPSTTYDPGTGNVVLTTNDLKAAYDVYVASPEYAKTCFQNWKNFLDQGGQYPSQYTLVSQSTSSWGFLRPTIFATPSEAAEYFDLMNTNKSRLTIRN